MTIFFSIECLRVGGAQTFVLRLAQALAREHKVFIYYHIWDYIAPDMVKKLAPDVPILTYKPPLDWIIRKVDRLLYKLKIDFSFRNKIIARNLRKTVLQKQPAIVHSNMFKADYVTAIALKDTVPIIVTMHGSYESFLFHYQGKVPGEVILNYPKKLHATLNSIQGLAYLTEKNLSSIKYLNSQDKKFTFIKSKIYNGFEGKFDKNKDVTRHKLGISADSIVFGLVARGVPAKGWQEAIDAFLDLKSRVKQAVYLILVGYSDYVEKLKQQYTFSKEIFFIGHSENPVEWVDLFDVGLLPSYTESLPNAVIEYIFCGKAVIATDVGEVKYMIECNNKKGGIIINLDDSGKPKVSELVNSMSEYVENKQLLIEHGAIAKEAFKKFEMSKCTGSYLKFYNYCIKNKK